MEEKGISAGKEGKFVSATSEGHTRYAVRYDGEPKCTFLETLRSCFGEVNKNFLFHFRLHKGEFYTVDKLGIVTSSKIRNFKQAKFGNTPFKGSARKEEIERMIRDKFVIYKTSDSYRLAIRYGGETIGTLSAFFRMRVTIPPGTFGSRKLGCYIDAIEDGDEGIITVVNIDSENFRQGFSEARHARQMLRELRKSTREEEMAKRREARMEKANDFKRKQEKSARFFELYNERMNKKKEEKVVFRKLVAIDTLDGPVIALRYANEPPELLKRIFPDLNTIAMNFTRGQLSVGEYYTCSNHGVLYSIDISVENYIAGVDEFCDVESFLREFRKTRRSASEMYQDYISHKTASEKIERRLHIDLEAEPGWDKPEEARELAARVAYQYGDMSVETFRANFGMLEADLRPDVKAIPLAPEAEKPEPKVLSCPNYDVVMGLPSLLGGMNKGT